MTNVIDALVVELGLDPTKFTKGQQQALDSFKKTRQGAEQEAKEIEAAGRRTTQFFGTVREAAAGLFTAIAGNSMVQFARNTMTSVAATGRLATSIGVATQDVAAFSKMIERNGGDANAAAMMFKNFTDQLDRFNILGEASDDLQRFLGTIGAKQGDTALDAYMKFVQFVERNKGNRALINQVGAWGGLDLPAINQALKGIQQVKDDLAKSKAITVATDADAQKLQKLQEAWVGLGQTIEGIGRDVLVKTSGFFTDFANGTTNWILKNRELAQTFTEIGAGLIALGALKPAAWLLRMLGLGALVRVGGAVAAGGAVAGGVALTVGTLVMPTNKSDEKNIYERNPVTGQMEMTDYGRSITGKQAQKPAGAPIGNDGLRTKPGADSGQTQPGLKNLATFLQSEIPGLDRFTAFNDQFHAGTGSKHESGLALDFTIRDQNQSAAVAKQIRDKLESMEVGAKVLDEYKNPSGRSTAGHIHVQFNSPEDAQRFNRPAIAQGTPWAGFQSSPEAIQSLRDAMRLAPPQGVLATGAQGAAAVSSDNRVTKSVTSETNIGTINVNAPQATDADGVAKGIKGAIQRNDLVTPASSGLN